MKETKKRTKEKKNKGTGKIEREEEREREKERDGRGRETILAVGQDQSNKTFFASGDSQRRAFGMFPEGDPESEQD